MPKESKEVNIGTFELTQPVARISDPCYSKDTWCNGTVDNCLPGTWNAVVHHFEEGSWGTRCGFLIANCATFGKPSPYDVRWEKLDITVGVDAGQAGIFDEEYFKCDPSVNGVKRMGGKNNSPICIDDPWYSICCDRSMSDNQAGVIPYGCNSSSGYGDGSYTAYKIEQDGKTVAIMIDFGLAWEEANPDEEYCCGCNTLTDVLELDDNGFCPKCHSKYYTKCPSCKEEVEKDSLVDGLCEECAAEVEADLS